MTPMQEPITSHDGRSHVAPHFDCFDIRNLMVTLTILLALHAVSGLMVSHTQRSHASIMLT